MVEKCPAKYKNLNYIQSFSEQGYATIQLMQQACMNDEWLRQNVLKLNYLSPPSVRKWFKNMGEWVNPDISYGYAYDENGKIVFNNTIAKTITVDFYDDDDKIDKISTTAKIVAFDANNFGKISDVDEEETDIEGMETNDELEYKDYDSGGGLISLDSGTGEVIIGEPEEIENSDIIHRCQLPYENEDNKKTYSTKYTTNTIRGQKAKYNLTTRTIKTNQSCNSAWYIGYNKSKKYHIRPDWINDWRDKEIPSVARGQTFKATVTGWLESIDLKLKYKGTHSSNCGSPLYVQLWETKKVSRAKTIWNHSTMKMEYVYKKAKDNKGDYDLDEEGKYVEAPKKNGKYRGRYNMVNGKYTFAPNIDGKYDLVGRTYKKVEKGKGQYSKVYEKVVMPKSTYDKTTKVKGKKKIVSSRATIYKPLAQAVYDPSRMKEFDLVNIKFDKEYRVKKGHSYFIALFSPLSDYSHCPMWGGWGRNCYRDKKYEYGNAFLSEDNGRTWIRYGRNDASVKYKMGKYTPQDFAFQCHIRTKNKKATIPGTEQEVKTIVEDQIDDASESDPRYLYLKPILDNPIMQVRITADDYGGNVSDMQEHGVAVRYDFSVDKKQWIRATKGQWYDIEPNEDGTYPNLLFVRAQLYRDVTTMDGDHQKYYKDTPHINSMSVDIITQLPKEMYVRTNEYVPRSGSNILGASIWGRFYSDFELEPTVECTAEIVTNNKPTDHFNIITVENVKEYAEKKELDESIITELTNVIEDNVNDSVNAVCSYLLDHQEVIEELKQKNVYIKPYVRGDYVYRMSFNPYPEEDMRIRKSVYEDKDYYEIYKKHKLGGIQFKNYVAYPIWDCVLTPDGSTADPISYGEWYDFNFDYDNNILRFRKDVLDEIPVGGLDVTYNKVFLEGLTKEEVGVHTDPETGLKEEGLILDYFKQNFTIDSDNVVTRRVKLRAPPVDPIKSVVLNRDTESEQELYEGFDYDLDVETNELVFKVNNTDNKSSILSLGDVLEVVYTPDLEENGLSVGYWVKRTNTDKTVRIGESYWEYKV